MRRRVYLCLKVEVGAGLEEAPLSRLPLGRLYEVGARLLAVAPQTGLLIADIVPAPRYTAVACVPTPFGALVPVPPARRPVSWRVDAFVAAAPRRNKPAALRLASPQVQVLRGVAEYVVPYAGARKAHPSSVCTLVVVPLYGPASAVKVLSETVQGQAPATRVTDVRARVAYAVL